MQRTFGLIGYPLSHSFSKKYFTQKFQQEHIHNTQYELFELKTIQELPALIAAHPTLKGLNVTIPYKQQVLPYLDRLDGSAQKVGAVNTIRIDPSGIKTGFNTDYYGFKFSLENWMNPAIKQALVLGTGGASKAVVAALQDMHIQVQQVSRQASATAISYENLKAKPLAHYSLIVNTTPLGMSPHTEQYPDLEYDQINTAHFCYDLVYNPEATTFMRQAKQRGAQVKNGLEMLHLQAEKAWEIWNESKAGN